MGGRWIRGSRVGPRPFPLLYDPRFEFGLETARRCAFSFIDPPAAGEERLEVLTLRLRWGAREEGRGRWKDLPEVEFVDQAWASRAGVLFVGAIRPA